LDEGSSVAFEGRRKDELSLFMFVHPGLSAMTAVIAASASDQFRLSRDIRLTG
jgi:hypothetical protein